jgi:plastocyanin
MQKTPPTTKLLAAITILVMLAATHPVVQSHDPEPVGPDDLAERFIPRMAGVQRDMTFFYGPFSIPPGQDNNRVTLDVPVQGGFLVDVQANLYDAETGARPSNQDMHIHHAHWFRASEDPSDEYYVSGAGLAGIAWVFGTGEERTRGDIDARSKMEGPDGPSYGIHIEPGQPQVLIYMLHNKNNELANVYVALDVSFVYGSAEAIRDAPEDCGPLPLEEDERCRAGDTFHHLHGRLWGNTFDVERNFEAWELGQESLFVWGPDGSSSMVFEAPADGLAIGTAGHLHPNGQDVVIVNMGPEGSGCEADIDGSGYPGVTLAVSHKFDQIPGATSSEEYQMGVTQDGWRAPIRAGDRIAQFGTYLNHEFASYEAMSYAGLYVDRQQPPVDFSALCEGDDADPQAFFEASRAYLVEDGVPQPFVDMETYRTTVTATKLNDDWEGRENHGHCGLPENHPDTEEDESRPCEDPNMPVPPAGSGEEAPAVHIVNFLYLPGDHSVSGDLGLPVRVTQGDPLLFINEDMAIGVRHTVTSCKMPCNGHYVANYPQPDGYFDSGKMGNYDYIDGGLLSTDGEQELLGVEYEGPGVPAETFPHWELDTEDLEPGMYSYYCRIHPWMRGWMEVTEPES